MSKPDITLLPSQGIISEAAARIYAAYIAAGQVHDDDADTWIKRSIREAIIIAKTVDASVDSHDSLVVEESIVVRPNADAGQSKGGKKKPRAAKKSKPAKSIPAQRKETLEELAEEVLLEDEAQDKSVLFELEEKPDDADATVSSNEPAEEKVQKA